MDCLEKISKNFTYYVETDGSKEKISDEQIPKIYGEPIYYVPEPFQNSNEGEGRARMVKANMAFLDILNSNRQFCEERARMKANRWGDNISDEERIKFQSCALILKTIVKLYKKNNESFNEKQLAKYRNSLHRYLPLDGKDCTMTIETAVDIGSALNLQYDLFGKESIDSFLNNYKKYIRVFVRSKTLNFYARSLEDICAAYCIFHLKTRNTYETLLTTFKSVVKEAQSKTVGRAPAIDDTSNVYGKLLAIMELEEEMFIHKLSTLIRRNPYNFTVRRYKEIVTNVLTFFYKGNALLEEDYNAYIKYLFCKPEVIQRLSMTKKGTLLNKILKVEKSRLPYLNVLLRPNGHIPAEEDVISFLRALTILYICQQFIEANSTSQELFNSINDRLTALGLSNLTYNRQYCHNLFDWSVGKLIEETKQQRIGNY